MNKQQIHNLNNQNLSAFKTVVKARDMDDEMFNNIEAICKTIFDPKEKFKDEMVRKRKIKFIQECANYIKDKLEEKYGSKDLCWHVIVGRHFGGFLTHQEKIYTYFYIAQIGFLIFATVIKIINLCLA